MVSFKCKARFAFNRSDILKMLNKLEEIRKQRKITQEDLADALKVSRQTIGSLEGGRYNPSINLAFKIAHYIEPQDQADDEYPLILMTGRILQHYHTRTMTKRTPGIQEIAGEAFFEINPIAAKFYDIEENDLIEVTSPRGAVIAKARFNKGILEQNLFMPFHYGANYLTGGKVDPIAKIPPFKVVKVKMIKVTA